jgi:hypothetical protein
MTTEARRTRSCTEKKRKVSQCKTYPEDFLRVVSKTLTTVTTTRQTPPGRVTLMA